MIEKINLANILFLDIETVPETDDYRLLDNDLQTLWEHKTQYQRKEDVTEKTFTTEPEFGRSLGKSFVFLWAILHLKVTFGILE